MDTNKNNTAQKLMKEILTVTTIIQKKFPELYMNLSETPLFLSYQEKKIGTTDLEQYLDALKMQLNTFEKVEY